MDYLNYLNIAAVVLGAAVAACTVIAPMTKNKWDDKANVVMKGLKKMVDALAISFKK